MSVTFGKVTTAFFGKTSLTKAICNGAFWIRSSLDIAQVWQVAARTCEEYPPKRRRISGECRAVIRRERSGAQFIAYGSSALSKIGEHIVLIPDWKLACVEIGGYKVFKLASAQLASGAITEVQEMEYWINEFEHNLRAHDPAATVILESESRIRRLSTDSSKSRKPRLGAVDRIRRSARRLGGKVSNRELRGVGRSGHSYLTCACRANFIRTGQ